MLLVTLLFAAAALRPPVDATQFSVGGSSGSWTTGVTYPPLELAVGDTVVFKYARGQHNVVEVTAADCSLPGAQQLASLTDTPFTLTINKTGTSYYACSVAGHCDAGMLLTIKAGNASATPTPAPSIASSPTPSGSGQENAPIAGDGSCAQPTLEAGYNDTYKVVCHSPGIPLVPSQVVNAFYTLPNPYPSTIVAVINQTAQIVDSNGREVPISEVYCHHFFGDGRFVQGEGAELRGSQTREPLPAPYYYMVNGTYFDNKQTRKTNIHLIDTRGLPGFDLAPCIECWCRDSATAAAQGYYGGTACCDALNCGLQEFVDANVTYYLQFNITYRKPDQIVPIEQAHLQLLEITNGSVEYDVHRAEPGSQDLKNLTIAVDSRCPQKQPFGILRCTGHLHIGGISMEMYDSATGHQICNSSAQYGTSTSFETPGEEHGYLVKMVDDTNSPPYMLKPGQEVVIVSRYDSSIDHFGVMGFMITTLSSWDPTCPGNPKDDPIGEDPANYDIFSTFVPPGGNVPDSYFKLL